MKVKKYIGDNIQDTIFKVKVDLGSDAIILETRKFTKGGFLGFFGEEKVEVLAGLEENDDSKDKETKQEINNLKNMIQDLSNNVNENVSNSNVPEVLRPLQDDLKGQNVKEQYINKLIKDMSKRKDLDKSNLKLKTKN